VLSEPIFPGRAYNRSELGCAQSVADDLRWRAHNCTTNAGWMDKHRTQPR
jgi:hypothetical protein